MNFFFLYGIWPCMVIYDDAVAFSKHVNNIKSGLHSLTECEQMNYTPRKTLSKYSGHMTSMICIKNFAGAKISFSWWGKEFQFFWHGESMFDIYFWLRPCPPHIFSSFGKNRPKWQIKSWKIYFYCNLWKEHFHDD